MQDLDRSLLSLFYLCWDICPRQGPQSPRQCLLKLLETLHPPTHTLPTHIIHTQLRQYKSLDSSFHSGYGMSTKCKK